MTDILQKIYNEVQKEPIGASGISRVLGVSRQTTHKYLKILVQDNKIIKQGSGAHVVYVAISKKKTDSRVAESSNYFQTELLPKYKIEFGDGILAHYSQFKNGIVERDFGFMRDSSVLYSSKIEGNTLDLSSYLNSKGLQKKNKPKEAQEVDDLARAYELAEDSVLTQKNLLKVHSLIGKSFMSPTRCGFYRKEPVGVFSSLGIEYLAIEPSLVETEMTLFFEEIKHLSNKKMSTEEVFFWAGWIHITFVLIHPFSDGNGRVARLLEKWFLAQHLDSTMFYLPTEQWYFTNRTMYYDALKLGVNYWEVDFGKASIFLSLLSRVLRG